MRRSVFWTVAFGQAMVVLLAQACPAYGRQPSLSSVLSFLVTNESIPTGDFVKDADAALTTRDTIARLLLVDLSTAPLTTGSPALVYRFSPRLGVVERATDRFGPFFSERDLTAGEGQVSFGVTARLSHFNRLDGRDLRDGQFVTTANIFRDEPQPFDVDTLTLDLEARTLTAFANVGVTDWLDVGLSVPFVSLSLQGTRVETYRGAVLTQARADGRATGLGDMALRAKWQLWHQPHAGGVGALVEMRLPTGDNDNLLGTGKLSMHVVGIGSIERGPFGFDLNGGFTAGGLSDEAQYRAAASVAASPRLTIVGELLGRRIADAGQLVMARAAHPTLADVDTIRLVTDGASTTLASAVAGAKWNVSGTWLLSGSVTWPLTEKGLRAGAVAQVGLEYALSR